MDFWVSFFDAGILNREKEFLWLCCLGREKKGSERWFGIVFG